MTSEHNKSPKHEKEPDTGVGNKLDSLLPIPDDDSGKKHEHGQVDGPMDELLRAPGKADVSEDDASTKEELEVDTTADGVDDFIPLHEDADDRLEGKTDGRAVGNPNDASGDTCLVCGEDVSGARFCPACGTEQVPASRFMANLAPLFMWSRALSIRMTLSIGALLVLFALLADSGTIALIISASIVPVVLLIWLTEELGGQDSNGWVQSGMMVLIGIAIGLPLAWLGTRMVMRSWFEGGVINFGATNFGGIAVETAGNAPVLIWLINAILLPLVAILVLGAAPGALRTALGMLPKERTGMMLSASVAAGYMIGTAAVFYWPLFSEIAPIMSTSEWTLTILGVAIIRPAVWVFSGAMVGAVVWRYLRDASLPGIATPAALAVGLPVGFSILSLAVAPAGLWASTLTGMAFATAAIYFHMRYVETALKPVARFS